MRPLIKYEDSEIDRLLSRNDEILPSSGFTVSVMDAVRSDAVAPSPIPFPWKRALPGLVVGGLALVMVVVAGIVAIAQSARVSRAQEVSWSLPSILPPLFHPNLESAAIWTVLALLVALISVKLSMRLASGPV